VSEPIMTGAARRVEVEVAVVGGGIGGLAVALSLHERGFQVAVFEQADAVRELGVGLNVLPPAVACSPTSDCSTPSTTLPSAHAS
jgi:flavin-dependent dehydrogenase